VSAPPAVSIVTPSLNQAAFLGEAIASVRGQRYARLEHIVVDGGSRDGSRDVLAGVGDAVRWIAEPDAGQAAAVNKGVRMSSGDILGWLNADDLYEPGAVSAATAFLEAHPEVALVYGDAVFVDAAGRELGPCDAVRQFTYSELVHVGDFVAQPAAFFRRSAFEVVGGLDESLHWAMDYDLWLKLARRFPVAYLPKRLARYRWTGQNKTARGGFARLRELERVGRRHGAGGLPAVFRVEKFALSRRTAAEHWRARRMAAAAAAWGGGAWAVLSSPRALGVCLRPGRWSAGGPRVPALPAFAPRAPWSEEPIAYSPDVVGRVLDGLAQERFEVREWKIDVDAYRAFCASAGYARRYPWYFAANRAEKALEHFLVAQLLELEHGDVYVDVASQSSPAPEIYRALFGCRAFRQDLAYRAGVRGDRIGGSAADMPVPDGFASALGLHCSFEHFEGDADSRFIAEAGRVLRAGGRLAIAPLYLHDHRAVLSHPAVGAGQDVPFDEGAVVHLAPGWGNRHGRFYDPVQLARRVRDHLGAMTMVVYHVPNAAEADPSCYLRFAALITKRVPE
jgi:SAM-dependent methyltransferase